MSLSNLLTTLKFEEEEGVMMPITKGATWCTGAYACQACQKQQKPQIGQSNSDNVKHVSLDKYHKS